MMNSNLIKQSLKVVNKICKHNKNIKIQYLGANGTVTGSCTYIEIEDYKMLIDFGMYQDSTLSLEDQYKANSKDLPIDFGQLDSVVLTHAHLDHTGKLGRLPILGFKGEIYCTALTAELTELNLTDCAFIMDRETEKANKKRTKNKIVPLYTQRQVQQIVDSLRGYSYNQEIILNDKITLEFLPAGHIQGASMVLIKYKDKYSQRNLLFTGDTSGKRSKPFTKPVELDGLVLDYCQVESTYAGQFHGNVNPLQQLEDCINDTVFEKRRTLFIPVFSISRSTEILHMIKKVYEKCPHFNELPIYLASPMSCKSHRIIGKPSNAEFYDEIWHDDRDLFSWDNVSYIEDFETVKNQLLNKTPKIVLASSGMVTAGYSQFLCSAYLPVKGNKMLFSGYQGLGTNGRKILDGHQKTINLDNRPVKIRCDVDFLKGMSSHADEKEMLEMLDEINSNKLKKIVIVHGEESRSMLLQETLKNKFKNTDIVVPKYKQIVRI